jgi:hypothetical protein
MTPPAGTDAGTDDWARYEAALGALHAARDAAASRARAARAEADRRTGQVAALSDRLAEQQQALLALADALRVPLATADLIPAAVPDCHPAQAVADVQTRLDAADAAVAEARRVAALPQLLPAWSSSPARAAVVYAGFCVPNSLFTVLLALTGETPSWLLKVWFLVLWPALTASLGGLLVTRVSRPRTPADADAVQRRFEIAARGRRWGPPYRRLGAVIAVASWGLPGFVLQPGALGFW